MTDQTKPDGGAAIRISRLFKQFSGRRGDEPRRVLENIDLEIPAGQFVAIVGRSGCGKSTLLRLVGRLDEASRGAVEVANAAPDDIRVMFQDPRLLPWRSVQSNVALGLPPSRLPATLESLREVGLDDRAHAWPGVLSGGQKQRVALARALVHQPKVLLLDEPLGALDALTRIEMQSLIEKLWQEHGFTTLLVTHDVSEAIMLADRVIVIENGRIGLDLTVDLPRPRRHTDPGFAALEAELLHRLLQSENPLPESPRPATTSVNLAHLQWAV